MGTIVTYNQPCLKCDSHDARQIYEDGSSYCFSCKTRFNRSNMAEAPEKPSKFFRNTVGIEDIKTYPIRGFKDRGITKEICDFFDVRVSYGGDGEIDAHYYPYDNGKAYKIRKLPKTFSWVNKSENLFGRDKFSGAGKRLIIVEGEIDALSIAKASMDKYKKIYPVVALSSASMAKKSILENREWIRSFQEVILCLDNDEAGQSATDEAIRIIGLDKVKIARLPLKDPNEVLVKLDSSKLLQCIFDSAPYIPSGIITREALWEALVTYNSIPSVPYPTCIGGINTKTKGARLGEIALFVSGTSCGKSTVLREIMLSMQEQTKDKLGVISLEESPAETARKLAGMALKQNPAKEEIPLDTLEIGFDKVFGSDRYMLLDHQGSIKDATIMDKLEYMALSGCKWLFIDHITILVSEGAEGLTGNEAIDKVMNDLLRFVKKYNVWIGLVSHLRKTNNTGKAFEEGEMPNLDDIKGSGSIKQVSFDIIAFARNLMAEDPVERNTIKMAVLKCRYTGLTGFIAPSYYDYDTGRFTEEIPTENFIRIAPPIVVPKSAPKTENYAVIT